MHVTVLKYQKLLTYDPHQIKKEYNPFKDRRIVTYTRQTDRQTLMNKGQCSIKLKKAIIITSM